MTCQRTRREKLGLKKTDLEEHAEISRNAWNASDGVRIIKRANEITMSKHGGEEKRWEKKSKEKK